VANPHLHLVPYEIVVWAIDINSGFGSVNKYFCFSQQENYMA